MSRTGVFSPWTVFAIAAITRGHATRSKNKIHADNAEVHVKNTSATISLLLLIFFFSCPAVAAGPIRIGYTGLAGDMLPLWVAQDKNLFKKYGLATEMITFQANPLSVQSLVSGEIQFAVGGGSALVDAKIGGAEVVTVAVFVDTLPYTLVASENIKSASQLKGKRFAVSRIGAISDISLRMALKNLGANLEKEAIILGIGDQAARFAALKSGIVDATVISPPTTLLARKLGLNVIASFQEAGIKWAFNTIDTTTGYARNNREIILNFLKGLIEGIAYIHKNKEGSLGVLSGRLRLKDRESLEETYDFLLKILHRKPFNTEEGIQAIIDTTSIRNPKAGKFKPQDMVDMQYLQEVERSGFIDNIYR